MATDRKTALKPRDDPGRAVAVNGVVILDGPDGVAVTMTPAAAALTADSLHAAAAAALADLVQPAQGRDDAGIDLPA